MKIETIFCDICGYQFQKQEPWYAAPTSVELSLSHPRQSYESAKYDHVCYNCVNAVKDTFYKAVHDRKAALII